ncbi:MAG: hypothetical protein RL088_842 [Verrucomicrobiota bacterium]|jgi:hypothetical protein
MKLGLWACIIAAVGVAHLALLFIVDHWRQMGKPYVPPPEPNFKTAIYRYQDEKGVEVKRVQEFEVSTKFADPDTLEKLPPPPAAPVQAGPAANK